MPKDTEQTENYDPNHSKECTDICCCLIFAAYLVTWFGLLYYGVMNGETNKLFGGIDWKGEICGYSPNVANQTALYWCSANPAAGTVTDGICVDKCPDGTGQHLCPGVASNPTSPQVTPGTDGGATYTMTITRSTSYLQDYDTYSFPLKSHPHYCLPKLDDEAGKLIMQQILATDQMKGFTSKMQSAFGSVFDNVKLLCGIAVFTLLINFVGLFVLQKTVKPVVYLIAISVNLMLLVASGYFAYDTGYSKDGSIFNSYFNEDGQTVGWIVSGVLGAVWLVVTVLCTCFKRSLDVTVKVVEESGKIIRNMPGLINEPLFTMFWKIVFTAVFLVGASNLASMGDIEAGSSFTDPQTGITVGGVERTLVLSHEQKMQLAYFTFGWLWLTEFATALGQYSISHAVVTKMIAPKDSCTCAPLSIGAMNGIIYHSGTLAFGAFIIGMLKALTAICAFIAKNSKNPDGSENKVVKIIFGCCTCCLACLTKIMEQVNEMVYVQCALEGTCYVSSCAKVARRLVKYADIYAMVHGITAIIRVLWVLTLSGGLTAGYWIVSDMDFYKDNKYTGNSLATASRIGTTIAVFVIVSFISFTIMATFDTVANAMAYTKVFQVDLPTNDPRHLDVDNLWKDSSASARELSLDEDDDDDYDGNKDKDYQLMA